MKRSDFRIIELVDAYGDAVFRVQKRLFGFLWWKYETYDTSPYSYTYYEYKTKGEAEAHVNSRIKYGEELKKRKRKIKTVYY